MKWQPNKPELTAECIILTAIWIKDYWDIQMFEILKVDTDEGWYFGIHSDHEEWGDYEDLSAELYYVIYPPTPKNPPTKTNV